MTTLTLLSAFHFIHYMHELWPELAGGFLGYMAHVMHHHIFRFVHHTAGKAILWLAFRLPKLH